MHIFCLKYYQNICCQFHFWNRRCQNFIFFFNFVFRVFSSILLMFKYKVICSGIRIIIESFYSWVASLSEILRLCFSSNKTIGKVSSSFLFSALAYFLSYRNALFLPSGRFPLILVIKNPRFSSNDREIVFHEMVAQ